MIKNFLKIGWRNVIRHKAHTAINVVGLALGITCCLFIFLWVQDERSMDNFHTNGNTLYSVYQTVKSNGQTGSSYGSPVQTVNNRSEFVMEDIKQAVPEVKNF